MPRARFSLRIEIPEEIEAYVNEEIEESREPQDTDKGAMLRWLSGAFLSELEDRLNAELPEGFYCKIENGTWLP